MIDLCPASYRLKAGPLDDGELRMKAHMSVDN